ncbi:MAG: HAD family hydrolase [Chloroflexota bacterium]
MSDIQAILFDMDDTLIDWSEADPDWEKREREHLQRVFDYMEAAGHTLPVSVNHFCMTYRDQMMDAWESARETYRAPNAETLFVSVLAHFGFDIDAAGLSSRELMEAYGWRGDDGVTVFPDVADGLQALLDADIKIGIVTNSGFPMWMREPELERFGLLQYFADENLRISAADVGYLKPDSRIFDVALKAIGTKPQHTLYVGDNPTADIIGSQRVGMRGILRMLPKHKKSLMNDMITPDARINTFDDLLSLLDDWDSYSYTALDS